MTTDDKSKQQSAYIPQSGTQQGSGQGTHSQGTSKENWAQPQRYESRSVASRRGTAASPYDYAGFGSAPFRLMRRLNDDLDRLFENFGVGRLFPETSWPTGIARFGGQEGVSTLWSPHVEMFEQEGKLIVQADLPGLRKEDVHAQIEDDAVIISGERHQENKQNEGGRYVSERAYGSFYRVIPLPEGVDAASANATFRDGVLRIEMASPKQQRGRTLQISDAPNTAQQQQAGGTQSGSTAQQSSGTSTKQSGNAS